MIHLMMNYLFISQIWDRCIDSNQGEGVKEAKSDQPEILSEIDEAAIKIQKVARGRQIRKERSRI